MFFTGIDRTISFFNRNLQLKADAVWPYQTDDILFSTGFLYEFGRQGDGEGPSRKGLLELLDNVAKNLVLEAWVSMPTTGDPAAVTVKLNYVIKF
jgi:hypothetical protein